MTAARGAAVLLALALGACGGGRSATQAAPSPRASPPARTPVSLLAARHVPAAPVGDGRLRAVVRVTGRAAPGQQLSVRAACAPDPCEAIAFADAAGRWRARLVVSAAVGRLIGLTAAYASSRAGERPARGMVRLHERRPAGVTVPATAGGAPPPALRPPTGRRAVIVIGDSLAVGMAPALRSDLAGDAVSVDARVGRPLAEGMAVLAATALPAGDHPVLALSLFTNDDPRAVRALEAAVRESLRRVGPRGCAVWATIRRPALDGVSYAAANTRLEALAADPRLLGRLLVVPWAQEASRHPGWVAPDGVHGTPEGYAARAALYAAAVRSCVA